MITSFFVIYLNSKCDAENGNGDKTMDKIKINNRRYIGSKYKMLDFIDSAMKKENIVFSSFCDLFGGTGIVGDYFNNKETKIFINDLLESNYISYQAWFGNEKYDKKKISEIIKKYNSINAKKISENYFSINFSDTYYSKDNCKKIGYIREDIENKYNDNNINKRERAILITSLLYAMDKIANTVGHYDAYRKKGNLNRKLILYDLDLKSNIVNKNNKIFKEDANELVKKIKCDVVYIDPPYNSRQYSDAYHLLENVAMWKKQEVFGVAKKFKNESEKSKYCSVSAPLAFKELIDNIDAKYIIVSHNNMGKKGAGRSQAKIDDNDIMTILSNKGKVTLYDTPFKQFNTGKTHIDDHKEQVFICKVGTKTSKKINKSSKTSKMYAKSPLNYTGGKYKLLNQLSEIFPKKIDTFIDLFCGGATVGVNAKANKIICNDKQKEVINILNLFKKYDYEYIVDKIENMINKYNLSNSLLNGYEYYDSKSDSGLGKYNKDKYMKLRDEYNKQKEDSEDKNIMLLTLIIYSFNNQIRFNNNKEFNMPVGKRDFNNSIRKNLKDFILKIQNQNIEFISKDFKKINIDSNSFVYCDPPYYLATASYNENGGWTANNEKDLLDYLDNLNKNEIKFALSNVIEHQGKKHSLLTDWCKKNNYKIHYVNSNYNNSNYHKQSSSINDTIEVVITNY